MYDYDYLMTFDEDNFLLIYKLFKSYNFYFIDDIVLKYLELFKLDVNYINLKILELKEKLGDNFVYIIGNDMNYLNELL